MSARVVVTGAGVISSIGAGVEEFERNLYAGCSGIGPSPLLGETAIGIDEPALVMPGTTSLSMAVRSPVLGSSA